MSQEIIKKLETSIENMKNKTSKVFLIVQDTKGNAKASISYTYRLGMALKDLGFSPVILHEKPDYTGVSSWLGEKYMTELPHQSIEGQELKVSPEDFIIVPELFGFVMDQISKLPCGKIVLSQSYDYIFETLQPGQTWSQLGFHKCITTSETQKEFLESVMRNVSYDVLEPYIPNTFSKSDFPPKPIIAIHSRDHRDAINIIKSFYIKFPQYRWVTFRDMRGLSEEEFAKGLKDCFVSVWVDEITGYGTFPLESIKTGVPVIGVAPNVTPSWINEDNGVWVPNKSVIVDYIADFLQNWLEDSISETLFTSMEQTIDKIQTEEKFVSEVSDLFTKYLETRQKSFEEQLSKLKTTNE
jgi:hypothetical protein